MIKDILFSLALLVSGFFGSIQPAKTIEQPIFEKPIVVIAAGDTTCDYISDEPYECQDHEVVQLAKKEKPEYVLLLGDLQYGGGTLEQYLEFFAKTWGTFSEKLKPTLGNHEYETLNAQGYFDFFPDVERFYSFDENSWHFIALDSNFINQEQLDWLATDLEKNTKPCILAFWHHPLYSSGYHGANPNVQPIWNLLARNNATLVLNGHDHHYERFAKQNGIREFIVGTGGRSLYPYVAIENNSEVRTSDHFGFLKLELLKNSYKWNFITTDKEVIDKGSGRC